MYSQYTCEQSARGLGGTSSYHSHAMGRNMASSALVAAFDSVAVQPWRGRVYSQGTCESTAKPLSLYKCEQLCLGALDYAHRTSACPSDACEPSTSWSVSVTSRLSADPLFQDLCNPL